MADEIDVAFQLKLINSNLIEDHKVALGTSKKTQTTKRLVKNVQTVGTSAEALVVGDLTTPGYCFAKNLDATNFITLGGGSYTAFIKLLPGEECLFPIGIAAPQALADTANVELFYIILDR